MDAMDITLRHPCPACPSALKHGMHRTFHTSGMLPRSASAGAIEVVAPGMHIKSTFKGHTPWHTEFASDVDWTTGATKRQLMVAFSRLDRNGDGVLEFWEME